jgi:hypothetical protein
VLIIDEKATTAVPVDEDISEWLQGIADQVNEKAKEKGSVGTVVGAHVAVNVLRRAMYVGLTVITEEEKS